jgi:transcriptional regulator with XRE-family HTH domain
MTWVPVRGALRRLREAAKLEQRELAKRSGMTERTIRLLESKRAPKTMYASTAKALAGALRCAPEDLATWVPLRRGADAGDEIESLATLPQSSTLARRAERERALGRDAETLAGHPLLGPTLLKRCHSACAAMEGQRLALAGVVSDYDGLPARAAALLGVKTGHGARFLFARNVARGVPFYATAFTRELAITRRLIDAGEKKARATAIVRVVVAEPAGDWKGFFIFEKRPRPHPFAFVVEELLE